MALVSKNNLLIIGVDKRHSVGLTILLIGYSQTKVIDHPTKAVLGTANQSLFWGIWFYCQHLGRSHTY